MRGASIGMGAITLAFASIADHRSGVMRSAAGVVRDAP